MPDNIVLVTGAGGFIGSNVVANLASNGTQVVACDRFSYDGSWRYLAPYLVHDILTPPELSPWLARHTNSIAAIVHMGAISATTETDMGRVIADNIRSTLDLWAFAATYDVPFIYASSAATYGDGSAGFVDDDSPEALARLRPLNLYGWSKHFVDRRIVDDVKNGRATPQKWAGLKFFNVFGPNEGHKGAMRSVVHQMYPTAARGEKVRLFKSHRSDIPDGHQTRDFVYVKDCCRVVQNILAAPQVAGIYNVGTGKARTFEDLARAVYLAVGHEPTIEYIDMPMPLRDRYQYFTEADASKLAASGLAPTFASLESSVADYVTSYLASDPSQRASISDHTEERTT